MKIINFPVRSADLDRLVSYRAKSKSVAAAKAIVHKQERARLSQLTRNELLKDLLDCRAEKAEQESLERHLAFENLMRKAMSKRHPGHRKTSIALPSNRLEFRIERGSGVVDRHFAVLASCAMAD